MLLIALMAGCGQEQPPTHTGNMLEVSVSFTVSPSSGEPGTVFTVDASDSFSRSGTLTFRWDWEDDGVWDTGFSAEAVATHHYNSLGYTTIRLEAKAESSTRTTTREVHLTVASKEMLLIPAGEFVMGSLDGVGNADEHPQHTVYLDAFLIGKYEVTNQQYVEFLNAIGVNDDGAGHVLVNTNIAAIKRKNGSYSVARKWGDLPVVGVSWYGAKAYAEWEGGRLPTEAEGEKAARGTDGREWPWGNWEVGRCNSWESGIHSPAPVGSYPTGASPYGVQDLAGNVYEWVTDWHQADYYKMSPLRNPKGPDSGTFRIIRGGSWVEPGDKCRSPARVGQLPDSADSDFGFRIAQDVRN